MYVYIYDICDVNGSPWGVLPLHDLHELFLMAMVMALALASLLLLGVAAATVLLLRITSPTAGRPSSAFAAAV